MDQAKMEAFVEKVLGDTSATMTSILAILGDRLGLFKDLWVPSFETLIVAPCMVADIRCRALPGLFDLLKRIKLF